jgi:hypothetical protein
MQAPGPPAESIAAADSSDWSARVAAGQQLAAWADRDDIAYILRQLLLDRRDTAVVEATCQALLRRNDIHGARLVAEAVTKAHDLVRLGLDHVDHLHDAVINYVFSDASVDELLADCEALTHDPDPTTATGAAHLANWVRLLTRTGDESRYPAEQQDRS